MRPLVRRWLRPLALVWERARHEHSTPRETAFSVAVGVFSGCTPFLGLHVWIALALSTLLRLNRLWAALGSRVSFSPILAAIAFCEIECAHRVRAGAWLALSLHDLRGAAAHSPALFGDWLLGSLPVGGALAALCGLIAYVAARGWAARAGAATRGEDAALTECTPSAPPRPSSECSR